MEIAEILEQFRTHRGKFPRAAVEAAIEQREEITPELLRILQDTLDRAEEFARDPEYLAHFFALYLLAQFREARAYPLVVRLARLPSGLLEDLFEDFVTESLDRILASVCGGDLEGIKQIIEDEEADEFARWSALDALVILVAQGARSREEIVEYLASLFRGKMARRRSAIWDGMVGAATHLWPDELLALIAQAFAEGLADESSMGMDEVRSEWATGKDAALANLAANRANRLVEDTVKEFGSWACFKPQKALPDLRTTTGRVEPAWEAPEELPAGFAPVWSAAPKAGRNDPCPCGSGKKYKKCCLG